MFFISYSRQQFYYTEYLVQKLESKEIMVWFDVQELAIGRDWQNDLNHGLNTCDGLVLIASRASLASPYVEYEWKLAIQRGIPIYVVHFEAVVLPHELRDVAQRIIHYERALIELHLHLSNRISLLEPTDASLPYRWDRLAWLPNGVIVVFITLVFSALYHLVGAFAVDWAGSVSRFMIQFVFSSLSLFMAYQAWQFIQRDFSYNNVFNSLMLFNGLGVVSYTQLIFPADARIAIVNSTIYLVTVIILPLTLYSLWLLRRSADLLIWTTTGEAPQDLRLNHYPDLVSIQHSAKQKQTVSDIFRRSCQFALHYHTGDTPIADHIRDMLVQSGHEYAPEHAQYHLVIVSNYTHPNWLQTLLAAHPQFIAIVTNSIHIPDGLEALKRYQWIDYRTQSDIQLKGLIEFFNQEADSLSSKLLNNVPESMGRIVIPTPIQIMVLALRIASAILIVTGSIVGLTALIGLPNGQMIAFLAIPLGLLQLMLASQLVQRRITQWVFSGLLLVTLTLTFGVLPEISPIVLIIVAIGGAFILPSLHHQIANLMYIDIPSLVRPLHRPVVVARLVLGLFILAGILGNISPGLFLILVALLLGVFSLAAFSRVFNVSRYIPWFPVGQSPPRKRSMSSVRPVRTWLVNILTILLGVWAVLFVPGIEAAGLMELVAFELGITGYQTVILDDAISLNAPDYFQIPVTYETPGHLDDIGQVIWEGRSTTGLSAQNAITVRLLRFDPTTDIEVDTRGGGDGQPIMPSIIYPPIRVGIPERDPTATVNHYIEQNFAPLVEQRYSGYYMALMQSEFDSRQQERINELLGSDNALPMTTIGVINPGNLPPPEVSRQVENMTSTELTTQDENVYISRFTYDISENNHSWHEWIITLQTVSADYVLQITGDEPSINWHISQIEHVIESLAIDETFRTPFEKEVIVADLTFTVPTESTLEFTDIESQVTARSLLAATGTPQESVQSEVQFLTTAFRHDLITHHAGTYNADGEIVRLRLQTLSPDSSYLHGSALVVAFQSYINRARTEYMMSFARMRNEDGTLNASRMVDTMNSLQFEEPVLTTGELSIGVTYQHLSVYTKAGLASTAFGVSGRQDDVIVFDYAGTTYVLWLFDTSDNYISSFLELIKLTITTD